MQRTKQIICFHGSYTNSSIMFKQLKNIIGDDHMTRLYDKNSYLKKQYNFSKNNSNHFHIQDGLFKNNLHLDVVNKIFASNHSNMSSWINNFNMDFDNTYKILDVDYSLKNYNMEKKEILNTIKKFQDNKKIKFDCALSYSTGVYPTIQMLQNQMIKNAIVICPTVTNYNMIKDISDCNILFIVGKDDGIYEESKYMFEKIKNSNNCELIKLNKGHIIPNLYGNCIESKNAINKINKFIDNISEDKNYPSRLW